MTKIAKGAAAVAGQGKPAHNPFACTAALGGEARPRDEAFGQQGQWSYFSCYSSAAKVL